MFPWQLLFTVLVSCYCVRSASTRIRVEDQGYVDIVVHIDPQVPEDPHLVQNLRDLLNSTSAFLHRATRELVYLKNVTIVLPHTWSDAIPSEPISGDMFSMADIRMTNSRERAPYTVQAMGCGERGEYIVLPSHFVGSLKEFRKPEQVMTHEWAHFRYGVFDEFGSPGDPQYPSMYVRDGQKKPNVCSEQIVVSPRTLEGEPCDLVEGSAQENCADFAPVDEFTRASSSVMFLPVLSSVYTFCDDDQHKHNDDAPNPQNALCNGRSTWDVISHNSDFNGVDSPVRLQSTAFRILKAYAQQRVVLVLDTSTSMGLKRRMEMLRRAAERYIQDTVPDGMELGIVTFNSDAVINAYLTEVNGYTRAYLRRRVPFLIGANTCIGKGLLEGVKVLETNASSIPNSVIILMSDGEENEPPYISDVLPTLLRKGVVVHTLALGTEADEELEHLAHVTGGKSYAVTNERSLVLENLEKAFFSASMAQRPMEHKPVTLVNKVIPLEGNTTSLFVTVDRQLGKNLEFLASGDNGATTAVVATSPSGRTYVAEYNEDLQRHKVAIGDEVEPGKWQVDIKRHNPSGKESVSITVVSEAKDPKNPPVRMHTFYSTNDIPLARASTQFKIFVELRKAEQVVKGAHVVANVTTPLGNQVPVWLKDNGAGADLVEGDGIYSGFFASFSSPGRYSVEVQAFGDDNTKLITPKRSATPISGEDRVRRYAEQVIFERYDNAGAFVVRKIEASLVYPPSPIRDLRVEEAFYLDNGTRAISLTWTSPGAHLDEGTCTKLAIKASRDRTVLLVEDNAADFYEIAEYDVVNGTLHPQPSGEPHEVTFLIPDTETSSNRSAHDIYFIVNTWNDDGLKSNRSNIATANFFAWTEVVVAEKDLTSWEKLFTTKMAMYVCSVLLVGVLLVIIVILVVKIFVKRQPGNRRVEGIAVFKAASAKYEVEKALRKNLLVSTP